MITTSKLLFFYNVLDGVQKKRPAVGYEKIHNDWPQTRAEAHALRSVTSKTLYHSHGPRFQKKARLRSLSYAVA